MRDANHRCRVLAALLSLGSLALVVSTLPLWWAGQAFPQIPCLRLFVRIPFWVDKVLFAGLITVHAAILIQLPRGSLARRLLLANVLILVALILLNQHRLQAWAYQFVLISFVLAAFAGNQAIRHLRWLTVSIYFFSAISKFDHVFLNTLGIDFAAVLLRAVGVAIEPLNGRIAKVLVLAIPSFELVVAFGLAFERSRHVARIGAATMHLLLFWILGPWGLNHEPGVLIWNILFLLFVWQVFGKVELGGADDSQQTPEQLRPYQNVAAIVVTIAMVAPLGRPWGWCDQWPSWALYAPGGSRAELLVPAAARHRLPSEFEPYLVPVGSNDSWYLLRMDHWSLATTRAPVYPQARFQYAVAKSLAEAGGIENSVRILILSQSNFRTGERTERVLDGPQAIANWSENYWLNTRPRRGSLQAVKAAEMR